MGRGCAAASTLPNVFKPLTLLQLKALAGKLGALSSSLVSPSPGCVCSGTLLVLPEHPCFSFIAIAPALLRTRPCVSVSAP